MGGGVAIPSVPLKKVLKPLAGDNRAQIQAAIDAVSKLKPDANGHRGAVVLTKGNYKVGGTLFIKASGVVLRGAGQGASATVLIATKKAQHDLIHVKGGASNWKKVSGTTTAITSKQIPVGARSFTVASTKGLKVGMTISVRRTPNKAWIDLLGMGTYGWKNTSYAINHERRITAIAGNKVIVDIPLVDAIDTWATGLLFDSCMSRMFHVQNRNTSGTGHGWAGAQTMFWNVLATDAIRCDASKGSMNWSVGSVGSKKQGTWAPEEPFGYFESHGKPVAIRSLYLAQLADRLGDKAVKAVTIAQQTKGIWNLLNAWAGKGLLASTKPAPPTTCKGIQSGKACCAKSCGVCGGTGCSKLPGGASKCCTGTITNAGKSCAKHPPPCLMP